MHIAAVIQLSTCHTSLSHFEQKLVYGQLNATHHQTSTIFPKKLYI